MKQVKNIGAQGDVLFVSVCALLEHGLLASVDALPSGLAEAVPNDERNVVGHSETGHDHYVSAAETKLFRAQEPFTCYLAVEGSGCEVVHARPFDTHESLFLPAGKYLVRQQKEYTPVGWRRVQD